MDDLKKQISALEQELIELRRDFHQFPELGFQEFRTADKIEHYLKQLGLESKRVAGTGVTALIEGKKQNPVLILRSDMDALPLQEENDIPYRSQNKGVMHACGHDAHMAMLLVAAKVLCHNRERLEGSIKLVFQPNEEIAGALKMIEEGILTNPPVNAAMGIHAWSPLESGKIGISSGTIMGGLEVFKLKIIGRGGHTGSAHEAIDPILAASAVIQNVQSIQTRESSLFHPISIVFGKIVGGTKANIIPDQIEMEGTIRYMHQPGLNDDIHPSVRFREVVENVCQVYRCRCEIQIETENIPLVNDDNMVNLAKSTAKEVFPGEQDIVDIRTTASEDFSEFSSRIPGVFMFLGAGIKGKDKHIGHHHPKFEIDESVLSFGVEMLVRGAINFLQK